MAAEAVTIELLGNLGDPIQYTINDTFAVEKGTLLRLVDARELSGGTTNDCRFAGIAAAEKVASDGSTRLAVYTRGVFDLKATTAVTAGDLVSISNANTIKKLGAVTDILSGAVVGKALETAAVDETIAVAVGVYS